MVAVQREDRGPWKHGIITEHGDDEHNGRSYKISITKMQTVVTRTARYVKPTPISVEQYFRDQMSKHDQCQYLDDIYR